MPELALRSTAGTEVDLAEAAAGTLVLYVYPRAGTPNAPPPPPGWDDIPGARGCTPHNCAFRDVHAELSELGARVHGLSAQPLAEQQEFAELHRIPYPLLNDTDLRLAKTLDLPTFQAAGTTLYKRLTLTALKGRIERVIYPVFPPGSDAADVAKWLRQRAQS